MSQVQVMKASVGVSDHEYAFAAKRFNDGRRRWRQQMRHVVCLVGEDVRTSDDINSNAPVAEHGNRMQAQVASENGR